MTVSERIHRANAAVECEKLMSKHVYYHAGGIHREEIEEMWVNREDCTWAHNFGQMGSRSNFMICYADNQEKNTRDIYEQVLKVYPEVEKVPDYRAIAEEAVHFTVSPIVEVAEDGQSAKAYFYTPGCIFSTLNPQQAREGMWIWERYGADFELENGEWKFLNLKVCCDAAGPMDVENWHTIGFTPSLPSDEDESAESPAPADSAPAEDEAAPTHPGPLHFTLTETQLPQDRPFMPVPYRTFSETYDLATLTGRYEGEAEHV